jgi:hypothetical protein
MAIRARRFLVTLKLAPALRIRLRRSLTCATVSPWLRVTTTTEVSASVEDKPAMVSAFCERSMVSPSYLPGKPDRLGSDARASAHRRSHAPRETGQHGPSNDERKPHASAHSQNPVNRLMQAHQNFFRWLKRQASPTISDGWVQANLQPMMRC